MGKQSTKRVAIYARYSTDLQNDRSVEDQFAVCEQYARRQGWSVAGRFADRAASGASDFGRPDYARMVKQAESGQFDIILAEDLDRLSRNMANIAQLFEVMNFADVQIWTIADNVQINEMHIGLKGTMNALFLKGLSAKVKRGMAGVTREGRSAGGDVYGYTSKPGSPGELVINESEANIVRRIFKEYVGGKSPRNIAASLNRDGVKPPRTTHWNASTINGSAARGLGILNNPKYVGTLVWNKTRKIKDPATGKRVTRNNPESEWTTQDAPQLRIVDDKLFQAAQDRKQSRSGAQGRKAPRSKRLLSGLLRCGRCGGGMTLVGHDKSGPRIQCTANKEGKSCPNDARYYVAKIETLVLDRMAADLREPKLVAGYVEAYLAERRARASKIRREKSKLESQLAARERAIAGLVDAFADGTLTKAELAQRLEKERAEKARVSALLAAAEGGEVAIDLHPAALARFRKTVDSLAAALVRPDVDLANGELGSAFRELVAAVVVMPRKAFAEYEIEVKGRLSALLGTEVWPRRQLGSSVGAG